VSRRRRRRRRRGEACRRQAVEVGGGESGERESTTAAGESWRVASGTERGRERGGEGRVGVRRYRRVRKGKGSGERRRRCERVEVCEWSVWPVGGPSQAPCPRIATTALDQRKERPGCRRPAQPLRAQDAATPYHMRQDNKATPPAGPLSLVCCAGSRGCEPSVAFSFYLISQHI
jgi:hypothetical protein